MYIIKISRTIYYHPIREALTQFQGGLYFILGQPLLHFGTALRKYLLQIRFKFVTFRGPCFSPRIAPHFSSFLFIIWPVRGKNCTILTSIIRCFRQARHAELSLYCFVKIKQNPVLVTLFKRNTLLQSFKLNHINEKKKNSAEQ